MEQTMEPGQQIVESKANQITTNAALLENAGKVDWGRVAELKVRGNDDLGFQITAYGPSCGDTIERFNNSLDVALRDIVNALNAAEIRVRSVEFKLPF